MKEFKPNTTQYPNFLFEIMPLLCESEIKVLNAIVRKTYGWHKDRDKISLTQMMKLTGLSRQGCLDGKDGLIAKGIISVQVVGGITEYLVNEPDQSTLQTSLLGDTGGLLETKKVVNEVDTQKKELQNKNTKEREEAHAKTFEPPKDPFIPIHNFEGSEMVHNILHANSKERYKTGIASDPTNCNAIYQRLISDDKESELKQKLLEYEYSWWKENGKLPSAKNVAKAWDQLTPDKIPYWIRDGHETETAWKTARQLKLDEEKEARIQINIVAKPYNPMEDPLMIEQLAELEKMKVAI